MEIKEVVDKSRYEIPTDVELVYRPNSLWSQLSMQLDYFDYTGCCNSLNNMSDSHYGFYKGAAEGILYLTYDFNWRE